MLTASVKSHYFIGDSKYCHSAVRSSAAAVLLVVVVVAVVVVTITIRDRTGPDRTGPDGAVGITTEF